MEHETALFYSRHFSRARCREEWHRSGSNFACKRQFTCLIWCLRLAKRHFAMSERKAVIKNADMGEGMQQEAVDIASQVCVGTDRCVTHDA